MAITSFQRQVCRLLAAQRIRSGESYVAGGVALNALLGEPRVSRDIDLFHDTREALAASWDADRRLLDASGFTVRVVRERPTFVEAVVRRESDAVALQWVCDSAYRFFPLQENQDFGLTLHPFDLATNKMLALVGRLEPRDWIDIIACSRKVQHLGYLAWAACGKDPGFSPGLILTEARRSGRFSADELADLAFAGEAPDAGALSRAWKTILVEASRIVEELPADKAGRCVLTSEGGLFCGRPAEIEDALDRQQIRFHEGSIRGVLPEVRA